LLSRRRRYPIAIDPDSGHAINRAKSIGFRPTQWIRTLLRTANKRPGCADR
jgi:hypothetical protein